MSTETLKTNWQSMPKHAKVGDYKSIISHKYANQYDEYAFRVFTGEPYKYSTVLEFIVDFLEKKGAWVSEPDLRGEARSMSYHDIVIYSALERLRSLANIGSMWNKEKRTMEYRWYERQEGDDLNQSAIDNF